MSALWKVYCSTDHISKLNKYSPLKKDIFTCRASKLLLSLLFFLHLGHLWYFSGTVSFLPLLNEHTKACSPTCHHHLYLPHFCAFWAFMPLWFQQRCVCTGDEKTWAAVIHTRGKKWGYIPHRWHSYLWNTWLRPVNPFVWVTKYQTPIVTFSLGE